MTLSDEWWGVRFAVEAALERADEPGMFVRVQEQSSSQARVRYVQALVLDGGVHLECVGPLGDDAPDEGLWPMTDVQLGRLLDTGWSLPKPGTYPNLWRVEPRSLIGHTTKILVEALAVLGCDPTTHGFDLTEGRPPTPEEAVDQPCA